MVYFIHRVIVIDVCVGIDQSAISTGSTNTEAPSTTYEQPTYYQPPETTYPTSYEPQVSTNEINVNHDRSRTNRQHIIMAMIVK